MYRETIEKPQALTMTWELQTEAKVVALGDGKVLVGATYHQGKHALTLTHVPHSYTIGELVRGGPPLSAGDVALTFKNAASARVVLEKLSQVARRLEWWEGLPQVMPR